MSAVVLRVRFTSGEHTDVTYEEAEDVPDEVLIERVVSTLASDSGVLRCTHGGKLVVLFGRGVASLEVAPRGAVL